MQRARDRRRRQREHVDLEPELAEELLLRDAEALLLVDDHEPEVARDHVAREHAVRPDQDVDLALAEVREHRLHVRRLPEARHHLDADGVVAVAGAERVPVLLGEHRRRDEHQHLLAADGDGERGAQRDLGLAEADVAADEAVHRPRRLEVLPHGLDRPSLVLRLAVRELRLELLDPLVLDLVRHARPRLPLRVELEQVARELAQVLARTRLQVVPRLAAELRERRRLRVGADVARHLADLLVRDEHAVLAAEAEQEVVARHAGDLPRLEPEELRDPVVLVHDVVAGAEVGERLERAPRRRGRARRAPAEDLRVRQERDAEVAPDEPAARRDHGERQPLRPRARLEHRRRDPPQEVLLAQRLAAVREGDDDVEPLAEEPAELVLGLAEPARRDRRPLRVERERLGLRQRRELGRAVERQLVEALLAPDLAHLVGLPDEVRRAVEHRDEVMRDLDPGRHAAQLVVQEGRARRGRGGARRRGRWSPPRRCGAHAA